MLAAVLGRFQLQNGLTGIKGVESQHLAHQLRGALTVRDILQHMQVHLRIPSDLSLDSSTLDLGWA